MTDSLDQRLERAVLWAREAGQVTLRFFQDDALEVESKSDDSPVTAADRAAETLLRERIRQHYPTDAIVGEEFGEEDGDSGFRWILDPIDGTKSFIHGVPLYGALVGVEYERQPVIGVIEIPVLDERAYAQRGGGAWSQRGDQPPQRASVSAQNDLAKAVFLTTDTASFATRGAKEAYHELDRQVRLSRTWGDCYGYYLVAVGRAEIMIDPGLNVWDAAAIAPILEEAGGVFTDWQGKPTIYGGDGVGTNRALHEQVIAITNRYPKTPQPPE